MTIKEKILTFLDSQGIKKTKFFEEAGLSPSNFKGAAKYGELGGDKIAKILTMFPNLSAEWLMRDKGPMLLDTSEISTSSSENPPEEVNKTTEQAIPGAEYMVDKLFTKLDEANALTRTVVEENGRLKTRIDQLKRELKEVREFPPTVELDIPVAQSVSRTELQST